MKNQLADPPVRLATVGLGNWAGRVVDLLLRQHQSIEGGIKLISVFEPEPSKYVQRAKTLQHAGVMLHDSFDAILNDPQVEAVFLPVPIHLHRPMTERALAAGKAVLVEKPASGCVQDVDAMIAARNRARLPVLVSFQDTYDPAILSLKRAILDGEIGRVQSATIVGCWPRDKAYYRRTSWAGKIQYAGTWVLDSPLSNAFAHYLHLAFFLLGREENTWADLESVESELYRIYNIENYDTTSQRFIASGVPLLALLTHACQTNVGPFIRIMGERGTIEIDLNQRVARIENETTGSRQIQLSATPRDAAIIAFARYLRGLPADAAISTLDAARVHVVAANGASQAAIVKSLAAEHYAIALNGDGERQHFIPDFERTLLACAQRGTMLDESGMVPWSIPAGRQNLVGYSRFAGCPTQNVVAKTLSKLSQPRLTTKRAPELLDETSV
jgi:predicted dehydrogenase